MSPRHVNKRLLSLVHVWRGVAGARARLLDPDYDDDATLLHTEAFRAALEAEGVGWPAIRRQTRSIMSRAMLSILPTLRRDWFDHTTPRARERLFALWRFDFLVDATGRAWLLELEIVPSTGRSVSWHR